ncbi:MAG TPA: hypothetical protein IAB35_05525 [Candidatus Faecimonas gallistercoris]|nr:hypothetical protein [Candidatus Faecimonas gallistercoris]HIS17083.1 hypothetical protein [Candidatus Coprovivens excrementavium]
MKKQIIKIIFLIIIGAVIGVLSKWGDVIAGMNFLHYFGLISSGIVLWLVIGILLLVKSETRKEFNILYFSFMTSMLISYYLFSALIVKYIYIKIIIFWIIMLMCSIILGNIIFNKRHTKLIRNLYIIASMILIIYDAIIINGIQMEIVIIEMMLSLITLTLINKEIKKQYLIDCERN